MQNFRLVSVALLSLGLSSLSLATTLYKWKDAQGGIHYSQTPPQGASQALKLQTQPAKSTAQPVKTDSTTSNVAVTTQQTAQSSNQTTRLSANDCAKLQQTLATLQTGQRVFESDANGQRAYLTDEQRSERIQRYQQDINGACQ